METIRTSFPKLPPLAHLLYGMPGLVRYHCGDGLWSIIKMLEGVNQGCPLSAVFVAVVLDRVLQSLNKLLCEQAQDRVLQGDYGNNDHDLIATFFGWVDDVYMVTSAFD